MMRSGSVGKFARKPSQLIDKNAGFIHGPRHITKSKLMHEFSIGLKCMIRRISPTGTLALVVEPR